MIVYRVQATDGNGEWVTVFRARLKEAQGERDELRDIYPTVHMDKVEIPRGRDGLCEALNHATVNRTNWPGEEVK